MKKIVLFDSFLSVLNYIPIGECKHMFSIKFKTLYTIF